MVSAVIELHIVVENILGNTAVLSRVTVDPLHVYMVDIRLLA